jgi:hypothetical protein
VAPNSVPWWFFFFRGNTGRQPVFLLSALHRGEWDTQPRFLVPFSYFRDSSVSTSGGAGYCSCDSNPCNTPVTISCPCGAPSVVNGGCVCPDCTPTVANCSVTATVPTCATTEVCKFARCDNVASCVIANKLDGTNCLPAGAILPSNCHGAICNSGKCTPLCDTPTTAPLPPPLTTECPLLDCASSGTLCSTAQNAVTAAVDGTPTCSCNCRLPALTRPTVCDKGTFSLCVAGLPDCDKDSTNLNGNGILRDSDSCCGTCRIIPPCKFDDHVACLLNRPVCYRNATYFERPVRIDGSCCRSCRPVDFVLPTDGCSACTADQFCVPAIDRDGNVRPTRICAAKLLRKFWVATPTSLPFDNNRASAFFRAMLERLAQVKPRLAIALRHYWHVVIAEVRPDSDCTTTKPTSGAGQ